MLPPHRLSKGDPFRGFTRPAVLVFAAVCLALVSGLLGATLAASNTPVVHNAPAFPPPAVLVRPVQPQTERPIPRQDNTGSSNDANIIRAVGASSTTTAPAIAPRGDKSPIPEVIFCPLSAPFAQLATDVKSRVEAFQNANAGFKVVYCDESERRKMIFAEFGTESDVADVYRRTRSERAQIDLWKLAVLWKNGGFCADAEFISESKPISNWLNPSAQLVAAPFDTNSKSVVFLGSVATHPILSDAIGAIIQNAKKQQNLPVLSAAIDKFAASKEWISEFRNNSSLTAFCYGVQLFSHLCPTANPNQFWVRDTAEEKCESGFFSFVEQPKKQESESSFDPCDAECAKSIRSFLSASKPSDFFPPPSVCRSPMLRSQAAQDKMLLRQLFSAKLNLAGSNSNYLNLLNGTGFFIEFGAEDGQFFSNSFFFEKSLNWRGILVEANPAEQKNIASVRTRSAIIDGAICSVPGKRKFGVPDVPGLGGFPDSIDSGRKTDLKRVIDTVCFSLKDLVELFGVRRVNYMSVDTEGSELDCLMSFPFSTIPVDVVGVESLRGTPERQKKEETLIAHMKSIGFRVLVKHFVADDTVDYFFVPSSPLPPPTGPMYDEDVFVKGKKTCQQLQRCL